MEVSFSVLKEKEIVNVFDGKKLGRITDILFDNTTGVVKGIVVPGEKKLFRKNDDVFIPIERLKKIGDDVILVSLHIQTGVMYNNSNQRNYSDFNRKSSAQQIANEYNFYNSKNTNNKAKSKQFVRFKRVDSKKYK